MKIHREGFKIILIATLGVAALFLVFFELVYVPILSEAIGILALVFYILVLQFFRNPSRNTQVNPNHIIAPADGKVVVIEETEESEYFKDKRVQISIFMSPLNVHVNRNPISGTFKYVKYYKGKYLVAWHPKSSTENERTSIVIDNGRFSILFRQIAGAVARRIVWYAKEGAVANQGDEFGFIKFGSRVDLFLPLNAKINVKIGEKTIGGETVLATLEN